MEPSTMSDEQGNAADGSTAGREPKVIKRYTNRKLYDTVESRYVTLDEIAEMIKAGQEVKVLDNRSKEDLTSVTLAQIIFEEEKKTSKMSLRMLRDLIRHGGERAQAFAEERVEAAKAAMEQQVQNLLAKGAQTSDRAKELVAASQEAVAQLQKRVDDKVRTTLEGIQSVPDLKKEISTLQARIVELEQKLEELKK
jgi:polyhydroxyalkanoate synthesis repressor PhaR